jgi:YD repeat-containing protein
MSRKRSILLLGIGLLIATASNAQDQPALQSGSTDSKLLPNPSGNTNLGSTFAPDLFNGTANISIPIYNYGDNGVSLSYNTAGIQIDEPSGFIGQHWNLQAAGSITRMMKDVPDEMNVAQNQMANLDGSGDPASAFGIKGKFSQYGLGNTSQLDAGCYVDDESDDFIFSVGGFSFTFNIGSNGFIFTNPHKNVQIDLLLNGQVVSTAGTKIPSSGSFAGLQEINFRVRDPQGSWYYFQKGDVSHIEYGSKTNPTLGYDYISKWVITSIVTNDGKQTKFSYTTQNTSGNTIYNAFSSVEPNPGATQITNVSDAAVKGSDNLRTYSRLESVSYPNKANVYFIYTFPPNGRCDMQSGDPIMTEIQVASADAINRYVFEQAYAVAANENTFPNPPLSSIETSLSSCLTVVTGGDNFRYHRLILKGIHMANEDGTKTEPYYKFGYNRDSTFRLPARQNNSQDYFGYYNGKSNAVSGYGHFINIPNHQNMYSSGAWGYGVDRSDDWHYAQADLLNLMVNAYGGQTYFYYGPHSNFTNALANADITAPSDVYFLGANAKDGVCLDSVLTKDPHYPAFWQVQRFVYSGGQVFMPGGYFHFPLTQSANSAQPNVLFNGTYVTPHQFVNGSNHGYSEVTITSVNQSNQMLGKKDITFRNISRGYHQTSYYMTGTKKYFEIPYTNKQYIKDWEIGLPLVTTEYDGLGNVMSITTNTYTDNLDATSATGKVENLKRLATDNNGSYTTVDSDFYRPFTGFSMLAQTTIQKFVDDATYINDIVSYDYDDHNNLSATTAQNSRGEYFVVKNIYNYNVSGPNMLLGNQPGTIYDMTNAGLEIKIGMERWKKGASLAGYDDLLFDANITKYQYLNGILSTKKLYTLQALNPIGYTAYTGMSMGSPAINPYSSILGAYNTTSPIANFQVASEVLQFDAKNNPVETQLKGQNSYIAMMWDTTNFNKKVDVQNARLADIGYTSFEHFSGVSYGNGVPATDGGFSFHDMGHSENYSRISGIASFQLVPAGSTLNNYINSPVLTAGKSYILTFWFKDGPTTFGSTPTVKFLVGSPLTPVATLTATSQYTTPNGWTNYKVEYTPTQQGNIQLTSPHLVYIDEMRLFPAGAMMKTWEYAPLVGATSSTEPSGRITYYEYDAFGRQVDTKDQDGNIISKKEYRIAQ